MEKVNFQPQRMNTVNPYLMVDNVEELIKFECKNIKQGVENEPHYFE